MHALIYGYFDIYVTCSVKEWISNIEKFFFSSIVDQRERGESVAKTSRDFV